MRLNLALTSWLATAGFAVGFPIQTVGIRRAMPTPANTTIARTYLSELLMENPSNDPPYKRSSFPHWSTVSEQCNTRETVLKRDGTDVITNTTCAAVSGTWYSEYDGATWTAGSDLDIDHVVPLKEAWISGAHNWTTGERKRFANDLTLPQLIAVTDNVNQAKGDKDPAKWMPPLQSYHCTYVHAWIQVKHHYNLSVDSEEKEALENYLGQC